MLRAALFALIILGLSGAEAQAQQVRQMLNGLRAEQGLDPVTPSPRLESAAMAHALDMLDNGFFGHTGSDGSAVGDRARRAGYGYCLIAENIAQGQGNLAEVMGAWANSPGHRANMLREDVKDYGLVRAQGNIWVMVLGRDGC
ncbi:CAP domain-containing protein [Thalassococcus lentus]|uniref:CAP domain-containing protein n=1 Tax=Thalassococcus lentus TaxID=1210524 RepID=A0ABT4XTV3_9RHOB|nr:CAP domain-containing protein [Thalassococcus lentus]MDA7425385.1 CAP domain-containing protein [Thalassococcus lentus]